MATKRKIKRSANYQIPVYSGKSRASHIKNDKKRTAKKPGRRPSPSGGYVERRENRSDKNKKTRL